MPYIHLTSDTCCMCHKQPAPIAGMFQCCCGVQRLASALKQAPILLVLDNIHEHVTAAVDQFLEAWTDRQEGSLLLATAWSSAAFSQLHEHLQPGRYTIQPMVSIMGLELQQHEASALLKRHITTSRHKEQRRSLPAEMVEALATEAAAELKFSTPPAYTPQVLRVCGRTLGLMAEERSPVQHLTSALAHAREIAELSSAHKLSREDQIFCQLRACYDQLSQSAEQTLVDLHLAHCLSACKKLLSAQQLHLWLSCHQPKPCSTMEIRQQVRRAARSMATAWQGSTDAEALLVCSCKPWRSEGSSSCSLSANICRSTGTISWRTSRAALQLRLRLGESGSSPCRACQARAQPELQLSLQLRTPYLRSHTRCCVAASCQSCSRFMWSLTGDCSTGIAGSARSLAFERALMIGLPAAPDLRC